MHISTVESAITIAVSLCGGRIHRTRCGCGRRARALGRIGKATRVGMSRMGLAAALLWVYCALPLAMAYPLAQPLIPQSGTFGAVNRPAMWQLPEGPIERVLVIYTPKNTLPSAFWDYSSSCPSCVGLPEKRQIVADALDRNYAVFVPQQGGGEWGSWPKDDPDLLVSLEMIAEWKTLMGLDGYPTVALGVSSGGFIISTAALYDGVFDAIGIMVSRGLVEAFNLSTGAYPPLVFIHMFKDTSTDACITTARRILESKGVRTSQLTWYLTPITPEWFSDHIPRMDAALSKAIYSSVKGEGWTDEEDFVITDSWYSSWPTNLRRWNLISNDHVGGLLESAIKDELMVAWAQHTTIARLDEEMFAFFEEHTPITPKTKSISSF